MGTRIAVVASLALLNLGILFIRPQGSKGLDEGSPRIGLVFDVGGLGDKSFNDGAWSGLKAAREQLGAGIGFIEPGDGADRESGIRLLAAQGYELVLGVGFIFTDDLNRVSGGFPNTHFAGIDYSVSFGPDGQPLPPPKNVLALKFREEEGCYLVGALAGLTTKTRTVGFVGGMDIPLIHKFEAGYRAGVLKVCPDCTVLAAYAGVTPQAFRDPGKGKELALSFYGRGADILFHASGSTGLGVFEAARERNALAIGVDADQWAEAPGHILTSMIKRVDRAMLEAARQVKEGQFKGGVLTLGLKEGGVDYVFDQNNKQLIPDAVRQQVEALREQIASGALQVPDH